MNRILAVSFQWCLAGRVPSLSSTAGRWARVTVTPGARALWADVPHSELQTVCQWGTGCERGRGGRRWWQAYSMIAVIRPCLGRFHATWCHLTKGPWHPTQSLPHSRHSSPDHGHSRVTEALSFLSVGTKGYVVFIDIETLPRPSSPTTTSSSGSSSAARPRRGTCPLAGRTAGSSRRTRRGWWTVAPSAPAR